MMDYKLLESKALWVRQQVLNMIVAANKGHIGGSLSCTDLLVALYQGGILSVDSNDIYNPDRDRFILSKGHAIESLYAVLADMGYFPVEELQTYGKPGSRLLSHPYFKFPGIDVTTGSLGHGLGIGAGLALAAKLDGKSYKTFVLLGDGECYEGSIWEAAMFVAHHQLNQLYVIIDRNRQLTLDFTEDCIHLEPLKDKWKAFGWNVIEVDGHDIGTFIETVHNVFNLHINKPTIFIAYTVKGKGISYMENKIGWHHNVPKGDQVTIARKDLLNG